MADWPPEGYSDPQPIKDTQSTVLLIALAIGVPLVYVLRPYLRELANPLLAVMPILSKTLGFSDSSGIYLTAGFVLTVVLLTVLGLLFRWAIIPVHERIHYEMDRLMGLNPEYLYVDFLFLKNPGVLAVNTGTSRGQHIPSSLAPFVIIGIASLTGVLLLDGFAAGLAAFVLTVNSAASGKDVYNVIRMLMLPNDALYASFIEDGEPRSEYAIPESDA